MVLPEKFEHSTVLMALINRLIKLFRRDSLEVDDPGVRQDMAGNACAFDAVEEFDIVEEEGEALVKEHADCVDHSTT